jgi:molybdopterin-guanine dinucleotide biosynthesis protein A
VSTTDAAAVLLTGGASRRMGVAKASLVIGGETLAVRGARVLQGVCAPVVEVGTGHSELRCVREEPAGEGPLAGFLAGATALATDAPIVLLACDLPFVDEPFIRTLLAHRGTGSVVPTVDGHRQYACSCWSPVAIAMARTAFAAGERAMRALLAAGDTTLFRADDHARLLADVDTPEDLARLGLTGDRDR